MDDCLLAIDLGTSTVKVVAFDLDGRPLATFQQEIPLYSPDPMALESDAAAWWEIVARGLRTVLTTVPAGAVRAIGLCGFMHTLVPIDARGRPLDRPLLWPDQRARTALLALAPYQEQIVQIQGRPPTTLSCLAKLAWLRQHRPDVLARATAWLPPKDFLRFCLTGELATDARDAAGTMLTEAATGQWSEALLALVGLRPAHLPPIQSPTAIAGLVTPTAARATGLRPGTPVVVGSGDWFTTIVGSGCYLPERTCFYMGTAGILGSFVSRAALESLGPTRHFGTVTATGAALRWARALLGAAATFADLCQTAAESPPGARGLLFLPHLMGERGGQYNPDARGAFIGLTLAHTPADLLRAVLEGCAFCLWTACQPFLAEHDPGRFLAIGGGAQSPLWRSIMAAVFQRPLLVPDCLEGGARGAALLAAVGVGLCQGIATTLDRWVRIVDHTSPDPALVAIYAQALERYRLADRRLFPLWPQLAAGPSG